MIEKIILTKDSPEALLNCKKGFKTLTLISACSNNPFTGERTNGISLQLKSKNKLLNMYSWNIPGTLEFDCYDLLKSTKNLPTLENELFTLLSINGKEILEKEDLKITIEIAYD